MSQAISGINSFFSALAHRLSYCQGKTLSFFRHLGLCFCCSFSLPHTGTFLIHISFMSLLKYYLIEEAFPGPPFKLCNNTPAPRGPYFAIPSPLHYSLQHCHAYCVVPYVCLLLSTPTDGEGNGNPLQCSCLENPRDGGAWWAAVYGVAQSRMRLKWLSSTPTEHKEHESKDLACMKTAHCLICSSYS